MSIRKAVKTGLVLALAGSLTLTACGSSGSGDGGKVTLRFTFWGADERASRYKEAISLFEDQHPDIDVQPSFAEFAGYWTQRSTDATGQDLPDVFQMDMAYLQEYAMNGLLYDMSEFTGQQIDLSQIDDQLAAAGEVEGQQVGVPLGSNTFSLQINPDLLDTLGVDAPGWDYTWEEFNDFAAEASRAGADMDPQVYGSGDYTTTWWIFLQYLLQQGVQPFDENGEWNFTEEDLSGFLALTDDVRDEMFPIERTDQLGDLGGFAAGESPTEFNWDNFISSNAAELESENLELMPPPSGPDGEKHMFFKPSMLLSMGANTGYPEESAQLIDFLVNDPEAGQIIGTDLGVPASQGRLDALRVQEGSYEEKVIEYEQRVRDEGYVTEQVPIHPQGFGAVEGEYVEVLGNEYAYEQIDSDEFVSRFFDALETHIVTS